MKRSTARLDRDPMDKLLSDKQRGVIKVSSMLAKETLVKMFTIGDIEYKAGEKIPLEVIKNISRFALRSVVQSYNSKVQAGINITKNNFQRQKKVLKENHEENSIY